MPEPKIFSVYSFTPEPPKKSPVIKLSCGIGDTDGFPAFDVDSEQYAAKDDSKWGFLITGGAEFHMPLTVFQVTPDGLADKGGICLGDIILEINEEDATPLTLTQAHDKIDASGKKVQFLVKSMDEEELMDGYELGAERSIVLRVPKPPPPPKVSAIEKRLQELQRKLSEIAEIPKILSSTLATVSQTFDKLTTPPPSMPQPSHCHQHFQTGNECCALFYDNEQKRKMSYDEDVYDYELSDENDNQDEGNDIKDEDEFDAQKAYLQLKQYVASQTKSKDVSPESDYASESNYPRKGIKSQPQQNDHGENDEFSDNDDEGNGNAAISTSDEEANEERTCCDMYEEFNLSLLKMPFSHAGHEEHDQVVEQEITDDDQDDDDDEDEDDDDDDDFLTTTFTWNLRNKLNLEANETDGKDQNIATGDGDETLDKEPDATLNIESEAFLYKSKEITCEKEELLKVPTPEKEQKVDKLERSWPWADREKIIYKQSTCHLVPYKPLGLIEQRIQLLAKRNLLEHISKIKNPQ